MTNLPPHDLTFLAPPRISSALFARILADAHSPAMREAAVCYATALTFGLDPAIALGFFHHESTYGTAGAAVATKNWGNLRRSQGRAIGMLNGFATYRSWADSLHDWCTLIANTYVIGRGLTTVRAALHVYAPSSDGNAPTRYADSVMADVARWQIMDTIGTHDKQYVVKQAVTGGATIRAAPRTNAAILGRLHAGDSWSGEELPGQLVSIAGFGSSATWIRSVDLRCVWSGLLQEVKIK